MRQPIPNQSCTDIIFNLTVTKSLCLSVSSKAINMCDLINRAFRNVPAVIIDDTEVHIKKMSAGFDIKLRPLCNIKFQKVSLNTHRGRDVQVTSSSQTYIDRLYSIHWLLKVFVLQPMMANSANHEVDKKPVAKGNCQCCGTSMKSAKVRRCSFCEGNVLESCLISKGSMCRQCTTHMCNHTIISNKKYPNI